MTKSRSNAVANAAKGDLTVGSGANLSGVLGVGSNGDTIVADSSTATGLRYQATQAAGKNYFINGGFDIWQRGTSFTPTTAGFNYCADRWYEALNTGTSGITMSQSTDAATGFKYSLKTQRTAANTSTPAIYLIQSLESINSIPLAGQTVTLSMWVKKGANWSGTIFNNNIYTGTGTDQGGFPSTFTGATTPLGIAITPTTSWVRYSATGIIPSNATQIGLLSQWAASGTAGADDSLYVTGVQLEIGSVATAFTRAGGTIQGELAACQRYYYRMNSDAGSTFAVFSQGSASSTTSTNLVQVFPVQMRVKPTVLDAPTPLATFFNIVDAVGNAQSPTALALDGAQSSASQVFFSATVGAGLTQFRPYVIRGNNNSGAYIGWSAEL